MKVLRCPRCGSFEVEILDAGDFFRCVSCDTVGDCERCLQREWFVDIQVDKNKIEEVQDED